MGQAQHYQKMECCFTDKEFSRYYIKRLGVIDPDEVPIAFFMAFGDETKLHFETLLPLLVPC